MAKELLPFTILVFGAGILLFGLGNALLPLGIAVFLAYLLFPLIKKFEAWGIRRVFAISAALCSAIGLITLLMILLIPALIEELRTFLHALPNFTETALLKAEMYAARFGYDLPIDKENLLIQTKTYLSGLFLENIKTVGLFFGKTFSGILDLLLFVLNLLLVPVFFFYVITDYERISATAKSLIPSRFRNWFDSFFERAEMILSAYFRGQLLVSLILGLLYGIGFSVIGLRFGFLIGLLTGFLNVIPFAGPLIGLGVASTVEFANFDGYGSIAGVWIVFIIVQGLESLVITPKIVGDRVGLNALETMLALIIGGNLGGFIGMLIAIPIGGIAKTLLLECKEHYLQSRLYTGE